MRVLVAYASYYGSTREIAAALLRAFGDRGAMSLGRVRFEDVRSVGELRPGARVLLEFSNGDPAIAERDVGAGRVVLANFSAAPHASDSPRTTTGGAAASARSETAIQRAAGVWRTTPASRAPARTATGSR